MNPFQELAAGYRTAPHDLDVPMAQAVVAPGRTVDARGDELETVGRNDDGSPTYRARLRAFGAGETVTIPVADVDHLLTQGFILPSVPSQ